MSTLGFNSSLTCDFTFMTCSKSQCPYLSKLGIMKYLPCKFIVRIRHSIYIKCLAHSRYLINNRNFDDNWVNII